MAKRTARRAVRKSASSAPRSRDAGANKGMAIIAYFFFFVPLITGDHRRSSFVRFHTNQGTVLFLFGAGGMIIFSILSLIFGLLFGALFWRIGIGLGLLGALIIPIYSICLLILAIIGIISAVNGTMTRLPIIGRIEIIK